MFSIHVPVQRAVSIQLHVPTCTVELFILITGWLKKIYCWSLPINIIASTQALPFSVLYHIRSIRQNTVLIVQ